MCGKSNMDTYVTMCKRDGQWKLAEWLRKQTGALYQPGREVQREGKYVYLWLIHVEV